jgi:hypothetical protein
MSPKQFIKVRLHRFEPVEVAPEEPSAQRRPVKSCIVDFGLRDDRDLSLGVPPIPPEKASEGRPDSCCRIIREAQVEVYQRKQILESVKRVLVFLVGSEKLPQRFAKVRAQPLAQPSLEMTWRWLIAIQETLDNPPRKEAARDWKLTGAVGDPRASQQCGESAWCPGCQGCKYSRMRAG